MAEIIPSINVKTFEEIKERIARIEPYVSWCHLDVTDGIFSAHATWHNPLDLVLLATTLHVEVHLMVERPEKIIDQWFRRPIKRVIVHLEAVSDMDFIIGKCRAADIEIGLAIKPETPWEHMQPWFEKIDIIQILAVNPGSSGQMIQGQVYDKIRHVHKFYPLYIIELDGGVNLATGLQAVRSGANILVAGNYIFKAADIEKAIQNLKLLE